jgi:hypothetical protein
MKENKMATELKLEVIETPSSAAAALARLSAAVFPYTYHEISSDQQHVVKLDVLEQLKANISQLEDLHGRLRFMMIEVRGLIKRLFKF